jgi:1-deoxy-D-xylulose-5-phosphate reductoisomerase
MSNKNIAIYGSTGSIGTQALEVAREQGMKVTALCCHTSIGALLRQIEEFRPAYAGVVDEEKACELQTLVKQKGIDTKVLPGVEGVIEACGADGVSIVLNAVVGIAGLYPTIELIKRGKDIALANKETMVTGGQIVTSLAKEYGVKIYPVDSEHSAIFQCLQGNKGNEIEKIILTASGGPFRGMKRTDLQGVTVERALKHPNWSMGSKITIDSATLMNKGLEIIEAKWLFDVPVERIQVAVHPQSIVHSAVQYKDGSVMAQMGMPDMKTPIQYAFTYPSRMENSFKRLDLIGKTLTFEPPDYGTFTCLACAVKAIEKGGNFATVVNGANEKAVGMFLDKRIGFLDIFDLVESAFLNYNGNGSVTVESIFAADRWAREYVSEKAAADGLSYGGDHGNAR